MHYHHLLLLSPIEAIAALVTLTFFFYFLWTKISRKPSKSPLPPEIAGGWPVIGHLFYLENDGDDRPLARKLSDLADKYGPVFTFRLGLSRVLVVSSYDAVKGCYSTNDAVFANRPACLYGEYLGYNNAVLFLANYGPYWRNIRKLVIQEVVSNTRLEKLKHIRFSNSSSSRTDDGLDLDRILLDSDSDPFFIPESRFVGSIKIRFKSGSIGSTVSTDRIWIQM